ncbi:uncharacterized protein I303_105092 [Kwoniella dejecticola CBS 10117]|uniref:Galactose oxidase n=1 Tax=Kwoniella dejecticola CBS 10117 TaxID=1296121 RepID=A0AAJ8MHK9_9TREE
MAEIRSSARRRRRRYVNTTENITQHGRRVALLVVLLAGRVVEAVTSDTITPRWGHAAVYIPSPPTLIIQGGKTDPSSSYTYTSSPNTGETLILPLSSAFSTSSPPFTSLDTPSAPTSAWHTLSPLSSINDTWEILSFGGDGGTTEPVQTGFNSAWILSVDPKQPDMKYTRLPAAVNGQPMRRIYHSTTSSPDGKAYITGGMKGDGSGATFSEVYTFDPASSTFSPLPDLPVGLYHHSSVLSPNGTLLAMGGAYTSPSTGGAALQSYGTLYSLDTTSSMPAWKQVTTTGNVPEGRRGATLVTSEDGSKAFLFGGADATLAEVYGDGWELDLAKCAWEEMGTSDQGVESRFDHTAVSIGGSHIAIFGGYGSDGPVDSTLHIWDSSTNSWATDFTPTESSSSSTSATASSGESAVHGGTLSTSRAATRTQSASGSEPTLSDAADHPSSVSASASGTSAPTDAGAHSHPLTTPIKIGLILGILAFVGLSFALCFWRYRRRRNAKLANMASSPWPASGPRGRTPSRPYGSREKGGPGLMEHLSPEKPEGGYEAWGVKERGASIGLGMGAIGATLHSISSKFSGAKGDPYAELRDPPLSASEEEIGGPLRKSSRKVGEGIRLLGPRPERQKSLYYSPSPEKPVRQASIVRNSRIDMLREEDTPRPKSRLIRPLVGDEEEDWVMRSDESGNNWRSAKSILDNRHPEDADADQDPFLEREDSFDDDAPILPPVRGGPVPTPRDSRSDLGTFDEIASMSNPYSDLSRNPYSDVSRNRLSAVSHNPSLDYHLPSMSPSDPLDLAGLLVPPVLGGGNRYSQTSIPTSARSGLSGRSGQLTALSDAEEGIIHEARYIHSQSPTLVSPSEVAYEPIKRSESFFRRMAAGGITSLLTSSTRSNTPQKKDLDIRDPNPPPTLWPVISKDDLMSATSPISPESSTATHPPTSWRGDLLPPDNEHGKGPSLSSLTSARSMRDMVLVQREATSSSMESEAVIERSSSPPPPDAFSPNADDFMPDAEQQEESDRYDGSGHGRHPNGLTMPSPDLHDGDEESPGEIVFNGADFTSPPILPASYLSSPSAIPPKESATSRKASLRPTPITPKKVDKKTLKTSATDEASLPPSGSPVPTPLVQHRRPVRDVVNSINKRGGSTPFSLLSPLSNYSPALDRKASISTNNTGTSSTASPVNNTGINGTRKDKGKRVDSIGEEEDDDPFGTPKARRPITIAEPSSAGHVYGMGNKRKTSSNAGSARPTTMWEVIKKDQLRVANPDNSRIISGTGGGSK